MANAIFLGNVLKSTHKIIKTGPNFISPAFPGELEVKMVFFLWFPQFSMENIKRLNQALFPPSSSSMHTLCEEGFSDAVRFLEREALMS